MKDKIIPVRVSEVEKEIIAKKAEAMSFTSVSEYMRFLALNIDLKMEAVYNAKQSDDSRDQD